MLKGGIIDDSFTLFSDLDVRNSLFEFMGLYMSITELSKFNTSLGHVVQDIDKGLLDASIISEKAVFKDNISKLSHILGSIHISDFDFLDLSFNSAYEALINTLDMDFKCISDISFSDVTNMLSGADSEMGGVSPSVFGVALPIKMNRIDTGTLPSFMDVMISGRSLGMWYIEFCRGIVSSISYINSINDNSHLGLRSDVFSGESTFMSCVRQVLDSRDLTPYDKQICVEFISIYYDNNYVKETIRNLSLTGVNKLSISIYSIGYKNLEGKLNSLLLKHEILDIINKYTKDNIDMAAIDKVIIILNLIGVVRLNNNMFSFILKSIIESGAAEETSIITSLSERFIDILITYKDKDLEDLPAKVRMFYIKHKTYLTTLSRMEEVELGQTLFELFLDSYNTLFTRYSKLIKGKRYKYVSLDKDSLGVISKIIYQPLRLPMLCKPKE